MSNPYSYRQLVSFNGSDGSYPSGALTLDAAGNIFGTTQSASGASGNGLGNVYQVPLTAAGYAMEPVVLSSFDGTGLESPLGGVTFDGSGNLIGTAFYSTSAPDGLVFALKKTGSGFGPATRVASLSFSTTGSGPESRLVADAAGNLYGTAIVGGANGGGTVFTLKKTSNGFGTPAVVASFDGAGPAGTGPFTGLYVDAAGNLLGTTSHGGLNNDGAVFEIPKTASGFGAPVALASFSSINGGSSLTADAAGNLFGTTFYGGTFGDGSVFEIPKTASGYGGLITLASFDGSQASPGDGVVVDSKGNLFGTTSRGGGYDDGTVFELAKTPSGYSAPVTLLSFNAAKSGSGPLAKLTIDAAGNLFGTTRNGTTDGDGRGTVFELQLNTSSFEAALGAVSGGRTAVVFSGVTLDPRSTVAVYRGAPSSATLLGTPTVKADGSWSLPTTLAPGTFDSLQIVVTDSTGRTVTVPAAFTVATGITGQNYVSAVTTLDTGGRTLGIIATDAAGRLNARLTYAADRTFTVYHPVTGKPYTSYTDNYDENRVRASTTYAGIAGQAYAAYRIDYQFGSTRQRDKVYTRADGSVYAVQTPTDNGGSSVEHPGITGRPYTAYTNYYDASQTLLGVSYAGYTGAYNVRDVSLDATGRPVSQALLLDGGQLVGITSYDPDGSARGYTTIDGPGGRTATNAGLILKSGTTDDWDVFTTFANSGTVDVQSGTFLLAKDSSNTGTIEVGAHSQLVTFQELSGGGTVSIHGAGSVADIQGPSSNTFAFTDTAAATLKLLNPSSFTGQIQGFNGQSTIDLFGFSLGSDLTYTSNASHTGGTLRVQDGSYGVGLALVGNYTQADFAPLAGDGTGSGILIRHA